MEYFIKEKDVKGLTMRIIEEKNKKRNFPCFGTNGKTYQYFESFSFIFNEIPDSSVLKKPIETGVFREYLGEINKTYILPKKYTEKNKEEYFNFIKKSFKEIQKREIFDLVQTRKIQNHTTRIYVYKTIKLK